MSDHHTTVHHLCRSTSLSNERACLGNLNSCILNQSHPTSSIDAQLTYNISFLHTRVPNHCHMFARSQPDFHEHVAAVPLFPTTSKLNNHERLLLQHQYLPVFPCHHLRCPTKPLQIGEPNVFLKHKVVTSSPTQSRCLPWKILNDSKSISKTHLHWSLHPSTLYC